MKPIYQPDVQLLMDSINNQILSVQRELTEEFERKMSQRTGHLQEALTKLYRENIPIGYDLTELEQIELELQEMRDEQQITN